MYESIMLHSHCISLMISACNGSWRSSIKQPPCKTCLAEASTTSCQSRFNGHRIARATLMCTVKSTEADRV